MSNRRAIALAAILGLAGLLLGALLLSLGRRNADLPATAYRPLSIDAGPMLHLVEVLSSDALEGRASGTPGNEAARGFIRKRFEEVGLLPYFEGGWAEPVALLPRPDLPDPSTGANIVGWIPGKSPRSGPLIVLTAHFDHLGVRGGEIYNGADDNASGVAALVAIADHFVRHPPEHDLVFAALDAEEVGFLDARALIRDPAFDLERAALNVNLDMVSRSESGELYVAGTYHTPELAGLLQPLLEAAPVKLILGHDRPEDGENDWTTQSDHAVFHAAGMPFLYFGVEDHAGYHQPTDDFAAITPDFFVRAVDTIAAAVRLADEDLVSIAALRPATKTLPKQEEVP